MKRPGKEAWAFCAHNRAKDQSRRAESYPCARGGVPPNAGAMAANGGPRYGDGPRHRRIRPRGTAALQAWPTPQTPAAKNNTATNTHRNARCCVSVRATAEPSQTHRARGCLGGACEPRVNAGVAGISVNSRGKHVPSTFAAACWFPPCRDRREGSPQDCPRRAVPSTGGGPPPHPAHPLQPTAYLSAR